MEVGRREGGEDWERRRKKWGKEVRSCLQLWDVRRENLTCQKLLSVKGKNAQKTFPAYWEKGEEEGGWPGQKRGRGGASSLYAQDEVDA